MDKNALLNYALFARKELETQIALSLNNLGITKDGVANAKKVGDVYAIDGIQESISERVYELRKRIIESHIKNAKFDDVVEEFAYTWFNRIVAIRFMEVHDYFPHGFRVLTSRDGSYEPEILKNLPFVAQELKLDEKRVITYQEQNRVEDLYRYVLVQQCNALQDIIPMLFEEQGAYLELLLPNNLLSQDSIIRRIEDIPEEDFLNDVEVVGWLYQFYNSVKKDEVFASKKKITKETLPAVTQLFTPDWIVRYMAENSIGRIWLESYPNSPIRNEMKYYVDDAEQTEEVQKKIDEIKYKNVKPEDIRIIEPCCGSGHILVYAFDLLDKMYLEQGYEKREIPGLILKNNLYGLDVDKRAAQLAQFALIMKARSIDNRFFNKERYVIPSVYEILDSQAIEDDYRDHMRTLKFSKESIDTAYYLVKTFKDGKIIGSLLKVEVKEYESFISEIDKVKSGDIPGLFEQNFFHYGLDILKQLAELAIVLSQKYDVMITNPPYCGFSALEGRAKDYFVDEFPDSKSDMFAMFMQTNLEKKNAFKAMINMHSWMFLSSYEEVRKEIINSKHIVSMLHLGARAFEEIGGEVVQTTTFIIRNTRLEAKSVFYRLVDYSSQDEKEEAFLRGDNKYTAETKDFLNISGVPIAYWVSENVYDDFKKGENIEKYGKSFQGIITGDNNKFLRLWHELDYKRIAFGYSEIDDVDLSKKYWIPYNKGGEFRKWYGNQEYVVYWKEGHKDKTRGKAQFSDYYLKEYFSWSYIAMTSLATRRFPNGFLWDVAGSGIFAEKDKLDYLQGALGSKVGVFLLNIINPTINYQVENILTFPVIYDKTSSSEICELVNENIKLSKDDWDSFEVSWDFGEHPFVALHKNKNLREGLISEYCDEWEYICKNRFLKIKENEERLNEIYLSIYNLENELAPSVADDEITIRQGDKDREIRSLISYFIGIIMGRYSFYTSGIVCAGEDTSVENTTYVDEDGVVPIYTFIGIDDGLTKSVCELVKETFGETNYSKNIDYIANQLNRKPNESSEEVLNRYLNEKFYDDHLKIYQKRPIYWMLSSGKHGAFKCLIYLHRYNKNTLALVNSKYFLPRTAMYKAERERLETRLASGQLDAREKKNVEAELKTIEKCEEELLEYGQVLDYLANQYIELDLDDGVKENYLKFQRIPLEVNGARVKKDLLVPFGLEKDKK